MVPAKLGAALARMVGIRTKKDQERGPKEEKAKEEAGGVSRIDQKAGVRSVSGDSQATGSEAGSAADDRARARPTARSGYARPLLP